MRRLHTIFFTAAILLCSSAAQATPAQRHFLDFSTNLGWASAAVELHGDIAIVGDSIARAIAHFDAVESMIAAPYAKERTHLRQFRSKLANYAKATSRMSRLGKSTYLRNIWSAYQQSLGVIYRTLAGRPQMIKRSTCDSFIAQVGFDFGRAQIYAGHPPSRTRKSTAIQSMKRAISNGLRVSMDGYPSRSRSDDKLCCSFGTATAWHPFLNFRTTTPVGHFDRHRASMQQIVAGARVGCAGGNPGQVAHNTRQRPTPQQPPQPPPPPRHPPRGDDQPGGDRTPPGTLPTASFKTSFGTMTFNGRGSGKIATYSHDQGRLLGTARGGRASGYWVEKGSQRRCSTKQDGSYHWGRADFEINGDKLVGKWGYCNDVPDRSWTGTRIRTVIKR